ncbi:MAG TPA: hypothetical protein EYG16_10770 [Deltaproteobacteria bacterium]|nr:hypothetical protein [Candidatus Binatota bacterium]HIL14141.1 hypothetical protein [Deltaproteobacteria bacterium]
MMVLPVTKPRAHRLLPATATLLVLLVAAALGGGDSGEDSARIVIRSTGALSSLLFVLAWAAAPLAHLSRKRWALSLLASRRRVGLGMAMSHGVHLLALLTLVQLVELGVDPLTLVAGSGGFVVIALMAATSSDAAVEALGRKRWLLLHRSGMLYLWVVFTVTWAGGAAQRPVAAVGVAVMLALAALRIYARLLARRANSRG